MHVESLKCPLVPGEPNAWELLIEFGPGVELYLQPGSVRRAPPAATGKLQQLASSAARCATHSQLRRWAQARSFAKRMVRNKGAGDDAETYSISMSNTPAWRPGKACAAPPATLYI